MENLDFLNDIKEITDEEINTVIENTVKITDESRISVKNDIIDGYANLSLIAQKVFLALLAQFEDRINMNPERIVQPYAFRISDIKRLLGYKRLGGKDYENIWNAIVEMAHIEIHPYRHHKNKVSKLSFFFIATGVFFYKESGIYVIKLNDNFYPYLYGNTPDGRLSDRYTIMLLKSIMKLHDKYSMRMYALLYSRFKMTVNKKGYEDSNLRKSILEIPIPVETIRMMLFGESETYSKFYELRRNILDVTVKHINEHTNMHVSIKDVIRTKRKISTIIFNVQLSEDEEDIDIEKRQYYNDFMKRVKNASIEITPKEFAVFGRKFSDYIALKVQTKYEHIRGNNKFFELEKKLKELSVIDIKAVKKAKQESYTWKMAELSKQIKQLRKEHFFDSISQWSNPTQEAVYEAYCEAYEKKQAHQLQIFESLRQNSSVAGEKTSD